MRMMKRLTLLLFGAILTAGTAFSQGQIALYQMQNSLPEANYLNPAFAPKSKFIIGLPLISSSYLSLEAPFAVNDVLSQNGDSLQIDRDGILNSLNDDNRIDIGGNASLLFLGYNTKNSFINISFNSRLSGSFAFPGGVLETILKGPETGSDGSKRIELEEFDFRAVAFNEVALSVNRRINDKLTVGGKVKYLQGIAGINLEGLNGAITSNIDSINITMDAWALQTAGLEYLSDNPDPGYFLFKNKNIGWAIDLGGTYKVTDNLKVSASVLDIGSVTWKENTVSYEFDAVNYTFDGFDFLEIIKDDGSVDETILDAELDTLKNFFDPVKDSVGVEYKTPLTGKFYLGGTYTLLDMHTFGAVFYADVFQSKLSPAFALTYNIALGRILDAGLSASYRNKTFGNFGAALSVKAGPVQLYVLAENFESFFYPSRARTVGIRGGLVLAFGKASKTNF